MNTIAKVEACMVGGAIVGFVILAIVAKIMQVRGIVRDPASLAPITFPIIMGLFITFAFGLIGLGLHFFIIGQGKIGNAGLEPVSFLRRAETGVTIGVWAFLLMGFAVAYPVMRRDMLAQAASGSATAAAASTVGPSAGVLRADIGLTMDQVRADSGLPLAKAIPIVLDNSTQMVGQGVFDFEITGSKTRFEKCRYYFITTGPKNAGVIDSMNIGVSETHKPPGQIEADLADIRSRLTADGWSPGRFVWRTEKDLKLNGGKPTTGEGTYWAKNNTLLILSTKRMDDSKPGEDPRTAGEFIIVLDVVPKNRSTYATLEFRPRDTVAGASK